MFPVEAGVSRIWKAKPPWVPVQFHFPTKPEFLDLSSVSELQEIRLNAIISSVINFLIIIGFIIR